ncbi:helix-turn-helix domain-containing protein [Streptococcus sp. SGI.013]|uniref:helix-turn-helix domain-containing protein n=1 Tax=unclassified Streptococcus TaxID=2608887 RepID=UPI003D043934
MTNYGQEFKVLRELKGYSLTQVAKGADLSKSTLSRFENGETQLAIDKFIAALAAMDLSLTDFEQRSVGKGTILLFDASKSSDEDRKDEESVNQDLLDLQTAYEKKDLMQLLTLHECFSESDADERILKILAKLFLSKLSLHLLLADDDQAFLVTYFSQHKVDGALLSTFFELLDEVLLLEILESLNYSELSDQLGIAKWVVKALNGFLAQGDLSNAEKFGVILEDLLG